MTLNRRDFIHASGAALLAGLHGGASAQPAETGRIYVGFPAGTTPDILAARSAKNWCRAATPAP